nr:hypothetical protein [Ornithinimicrobium flavum]
MLGSVVALALHEQRASRPAVRAGLVAQAARAAVEHAGHHR